MTSLAISDLPINRELDADALSNVVGGYLSSAWQTQSVNYGTWGSWRFTHYVNVGYRSWNGKNWFVKNRHEKRTRTNTQTRWRSQWYD
jgi:hypothetical protein